MIKLLEDQHLVITHLILKNLVFGYIKNYHSNNELKNKNLYIEVEKRKNIQ